MDRALLNAVLAYIEEQGGGEGLFPTAVEGLNIVRSFQSMMPMRDIYRPSLCVVLQGGKELYLGGNRLSYREMECLVVSVGFPATGQIVEADELNPYVGVTIDFDVATLREVLSQVDTRPTPAEHSSPCAFVAKVDTPLADCILRMVRLLGTPKAIPVLAPFIVREICYWLISGPYGAQICKLAVPDSNIERVVRAVSMLHSNFAETLRIEQLADLAHMSPSSFHQHFKALTLMTPLQFQKQLRLLEARRLMVTQSANVAEAAYKVGYESPSQFSREYSRTFGIAPKQDALNQQRLYSQYASRTVIAS
ncbi:AraC family transcriptional regulator [Ensifer adhaerens]|uniref:AraC family transcriptional regulator n=1 Tax=Ensifer adhaerens TaxID=106592 RepID=A0A0L8BEZ2_ENSAD|nr:AraC family transcriptional regulator [Ensifer adhaerens]KOF13202.1 AraC family transcriptional regulator [Ensifer adhaerens]